MIRRNFIKLVGVAAGVWPLVARGQQQAAKMLRVGTASLLPRSSLIWTAFERRMAELGYRDGENYTFDYLNVGRAEEYQSGFRQLAARGVDIFLASGSEISLTSAIAASNAKPIVMVAIDYDPIALGFIASLARPGGNVTGLFLQQIELTTKRLEILKTAFPETKAATVFFDQTSTDQWKAAQAVASTLGLRLEGIDVGDPPFDYDKALSRAGPDYRGTVL
jgi:putative tryptophan/tyrosine transport system substrate-binding protein